MKYKHFSFYLVLLYLFLVPISLFSQEDRTITGKILSSEDGLGVIGATIIIPGTTVGTVTDFDGNYSFTVPADTKEIQISFIGLKSQTIALTTSDIINITLEPDIEELEEIVVTAVGIKREKKNLGYAVTTVQSDELNKAKETNLINSLSGKVAGVRISSSSGSIGSSSKITIRGVNSLNGGSPLFVVDGIPVFNTNYNGSDNNRLSSPDVGNRGGDINPEDIETITVLKGAGAAALYGSRAKDGVIMITTKRGKANQPTSVTINSTFQWETPMVYPNMQNTFAQGTYGKYSSNQLNGWGPKISDVSNIKFPSYDSSQVGYLTPHPDNMKNFYEKGFLASNGVSVSGGTEKSDFRFGYTNLNQQGIVPNSSLKRNSLTFNSGMQLPKNFSGRVIANYVRTETDGISSQGGNNQNVLGSMLMVLPTTIDVNDLKKYKNDDGTQKPLSDLYNNPYWVVNKNGMSSTVDRVYGSFELAYKPFEWLSFSNKLGTDFYTEYRRLIAAKSTKGATDGALDDLIMFNSTVNNDFLVTINKDINDFSITAILGNNINQISYKLSQTNAKEFELDNFYNYSNAYSVTSTNFYSIRRMVGTFADIGINYKGYLNVDITGRQDRSSTLPVENNSYFYPSINTSFILTDAIPSLKSKWLSYAKLRANAAQVGSDEAPYQLEFAYNAVSSVFVQYQQESNQNNYPHGGHLAYTADHTIPPLSLMPESQKSYEVGTDIYLYKNRIQIDFSYYHYITENQIIKVPVSYATGFSLKSTNAGILTNDGIELLLNLSPVTMKDFSWKVNLTYNKNIQKVKTLSEGIKKYTLVSAFNGIEISAEEGESLGLYGHKWLRDTLGNLVINSSGYRQEGDIERLGNIFPDWTMGIQNVFTYKNFNLSCLFDIRKGGVIYSATVQTLRYSGMAEETVENRDNYNSFIDKGVNGYVDENDNLVITSSKNTTPVESMQYFWQNYSSGTVAEPNTFDASYVKLREIRFGYTIPDKWMKKTFIQRMDIAIQGRNLWLIKSNIPHIDPEANIFGSGSIAEGVEWLNLPSTRSFGFSIKLDF